MASKQTRSPGLKSQKRVSGSNGTRSRVSHSRLETILAEQQILAVFADEIRAYLRSHTGLAKLLPVILARARQEFGDDAELELKVYQDPEIRDRHLTLYVRPACFDLTILQRMDRVTEPFDEELSNASGFLLLTTDH